MVKQMRMILVAAAFLLSCLPAPAVRAADAPPLDQLPVKGMVTLIDLGADKCIPCRMMAPILKELKQEYQGRAAVVFLDVWKNPQAAQTFGVRVIPTQIFFNAQGQEVTRHQGYWGKEQLVLMLGKLGARPARP